MENKFFDWEDWDIIDDANFQFNGIETVIDMKDVPKGTKFDWASLNFQDGYMVFGNENSEKPLHSFKIEINILD